MCKFCEEIDATPAPVGVGDKAYWDILHAMENMAYNAFMASDLLREVKYRFTSHISSATGYQRKIKRGTDRAGNPIEYVTTERDEAPETY